MNQIVLSIQESEDTPESAAIVKSLVAFNLSVAEPENWKLFIISAKDKSGKLVGGQKI